MTDDPKARGNPPEFVKVEKKKRSPWMWLVLAALLLALLLLLLSQCGHRRVHDTSPALEPATSPAAAPAAGPTASTEPGASGLPAYLAGAEPTPRTFVFERLHFDTYQSDIRSEDEAEVDAAADALKGSSARIRIVGYADSTGASEVNQKLGTDRAQAVKAAMVKRGVEASRIDTASGGEGNPVDTNATPGGRAENRRTELIVLQR